MSRTYRILILLTLCSCQQLDPPLTLNGEVISGGSDFNGQFDTVDIKGLPSVLVSQGHGQVEVGVYQAETGKPYVTLQDGDNDGVMDVLKYFSRSKSGKIIVEVTDFGMNGQPDMILNFENRTGLLFYEGTWRTIHGMGQDVGKTVIVDDEHRDLGELLTDISGTAF